MEFKAKKITVLGAGESGVQSALFLKKRGADVFLSEFRPAETFGAIPEELQAAGMACEFGGHDLNRIRSSELIVISPGIPPHASIYQNILKWRIPIWSEIELASRITDAEIIAVTGTNGKTTTVTLIQRVLEAAGRHAVSCGNIGNSFIREAQQMNEHTIAVVEVSSFQMAHIDRFRPHVAVLLNLNANHYDWHGSFDAYAEAKWRVFQNQTQSDYALINQDDAESKKRASSLQGQVIYFRGSDRLNPNQAAVSETAKIYGISERIVDSVFQEFKGLEHRLEEVGVYQSVRYINDSKSTTLSSLEWALRQMTRPVVLIAGGRHKGGDFRELRGMVKEKVKYLIAIGEAAQTIDSAFGDLVSVTHKKTLEEALQAARVAAGPGETVLFSPACASFDMFQNYEARGRQFKKLLSSFPAAEPTRIS